MSHKRKSAPTTSGRRRPVWLFLLVAAAFVGTLVALSLWNTGPPPAAAPAVPEYADLVGRWVRPDGGYVLDIRGVAADGTLDVGYFNPAPIKVARGAATRDGAALTVFVELRDVNYPGSTYTLRYDPEQRVLEGAYVQPLSGQSFDVVFVRE